MHRGWIAAVTTLTLASATPEAQSNCVADVIIVNANVHTVDAAKPSAQGLAICGEVIAKVGTTA